MLMSYNTFYFILLAIIYVVSAQDIPPFFDYDTFFVDPNYIVNREYPNTTWEAQQSIAQWAQDLVQYGPWSVMNKSVVPPSGDKHDYMSWAIYWWPNCTNVRNTTILQPEQIWTECTYVQRDGDINPDVRTVVDDIGSFFNMSDAVFYNAVAWALNKDNSSSSVYSKYAASYLDTWFLNPDTKMNPNLNYAQMHRGPKGQVGTKTGILDTHSMTKIASTVLLLRMENNTDWTDDMHNQFVSWSKEYIQWLETAKIAIEESQATNNHGTYFYNQLAALKLIVGDTDGAKNATETYFNNQFQNQIIASGEQPLEASRTRPFHYRFYNVAAMVVNAQILDYLDPSANAWNRTTAAGATIQTALDFILTINPNATGEEDQLEEFYPDVAAIGAAYGDPTGKYVSYLSSGDPDYAAQPYFFWTQPLKGGSSPPNSTSPGNGTGSSGGRKSAGFAITPTSQLILFSISVTTGVLTSAFFSNFI